MAFFASLLLVVTVWRARLGHRTLDDIAGFDADSDR